MRTITIREDKCFDVPEEYQDEKSLTIRMPYSVKHYAGNAIATYMRQSGKEPPYVDDGFIEIRCNGKTERFMAVDEHGKQLFWR